MSKKRKVPDYFKNIVVVQKNDFLRGNTKYFTLNDLKFLKLIISKIDLKDRQKNLFSEYYEITNDEIKHLNINEKHLRKEVLTILKRLASIYVTIDSEEGERIVGLIKNDFMIPAYRKVIRVSLNQDMEKYLLVANNYTKYLLSDIIDFKYKHTLKLYEYFKSINLNYIKFEFSNLRKKLELEDSYIRNADFKKVIISSVKEISEKAHSLSVEVSFEKKNQELFAIFNICRYESGDVIENRLNNIEDSKKRESGYKMLFDKECVYKNKKYVLKNIHADKDKQDFSITITDKATTKELEFDSEKGLIERLRNLFEGSFSIESLTVVRPSIEEIKEIKEKKETLSDFKKKIILEYNGKFILNNVPGFLEDQRIMLNQNGLITKEDGTIIDKEKALSVWEYAFSNKKLIGIEQKVRPIKKYIGSVLKKRITNSLFGTEDILNYKIDDIIKESENKYRLVLKNEADSIEIAKNTLDYVQLEALIKKVYI